MYNIYAQYKEAMAEDAKITFHFKKVQHTGLTSAIEAMKAKINTEPPGTVTYTTVANHISTAVSELPDYVAKHRNVSSVTEKKSGIYNADGTINTGHHPNWKELSADDRKKVNDERARLGLGRNNKKRSHKTFSSSHNPKAVSNQLKQLKEANAKHKRTIASLKKDPNNESAEDDADIEMDAGDAFGGKAKKAKK